MKPLMVWDSQDWEEKIVWTQAGILALSSTNISTNVRGGHFVPIIYVKNAVFT